MPTNHHKTVQGHRNSPGHTTAQRHQHKGHISIQNLVPNAVELTKATIGLLLFYIGVTLNYATDSLGLEAQLFAAGYLLLLERLGHKISNSL